MSVRTLLILGAGGHGKAVAEAALLSGEWQRVQFVDDRWPELKLSFGCAVVSDMAGLGSVIGEADAAIVAVGNNALRERWINELSAFGAPLATIVHPKAWVSPSAVISEGCVVMAMAVVGVEVTIGRGAIVNTGVSVDHDAELGDFVHLGIGVKISGGVKVGSRAWLQAGFCAGYQAIVPEGAQYGPGSKIEA